MMPHLQRLRVAALALLTVRQVVLLVQAEAPSPLLWIPPAARALCLLPLGMLALNAPA